MKKPIKNKKIQIEKQCAYIPKITFENMLAKIPQRQMKYKLIAMIMRYMQRRPCEACAIELADIDEPRQQIKFLIGKTNIITYVSVPDRLWMMLKTYLDRNLHTFYNGYIFPAEKSTSDHLQADTVSRFYRKLMDKSGLHDKTIIEGRFVRKHRFYDFVHSGTTDITKIAGTEQARWARRHTDDRSIIHYQFRAELEKERDIFNTILNE